MSCLCLFSELKQLSETHGLQSLRHLLSGLYRKTSWSRVQGMFAHHVGGILLGTLVQVLRACTLLGECKWLLVLCDHQPSFQPLLSSSSVPVSVVSSQACAAQSPVESSRGNSLAFALCSPLLSSVLKILVSRLWANFISSTPGAPWTLLWPGGGWDSPAADLICLPSAQGPCTYCAACWPLLKHVSAS